MDKVCKPAKRLKTLHRRYLRDDANKPLSLRQFGKRFHGDLFQSWMKSKRRKWTSD